MGALNPWRGCFTPPIFPTLHDIAMILCRIIGHHIINPFKFFFWMTSLFSRTNDDVTYVNFFLLHFSNLLKKREKKVKKKKKCIFFLVPPVPKKMIGTWNCTLRNPPQIQPKKSQKFSSQNKQSFKSYYKLFDRELKQPPPPQG